MNVESYPHDVRVLAVANCIAIDSGHPPGEKLIARGAVDVSFPTVTQSLHHIPLLCLLLHEATEPPKRFGPSAAAVLCFAGSPHATARVPYQGVQRCCELSNDARLLSALPQPNAEVPLLEEKLPSTCATTTCCLSAVLWKTRLQTDWSFDAVQPALSCCCMRRHCRAHAALQPAMIRQAFLMSSEITVLFILPQPDAELVPLEEALPEHMRQYSLPPVDAGISSLGTGRLPPGCLARISPQVRHKSLIIPPSCLWQAVPPSPGTSAVD